jgi:hypothetical protein
MRKGGKIEGREKGREWKVGIEWKGRVGKFELPQGQNSGYIMHCPLIWGQKSTGPHGLALLQKNFVGALADFLTTLITCMV